MAKEVYDFNELTVEEKFKYGDDIYCIPLINGAKAKSLFKMSNEVEKKRKALEKLKKEAEEKGEEYIEATEENSEFIDFQAEFIGSSICKESDRSAVPKEVILNWPLRVQTKIFSLINKEIGGGIEEESVQEKN